jgi:hypothetical protein
VAAATTKPKPLTPGDIEIKVIHDELKLVGDYSDGNGFVDKELNTLLKHYCEIDKIDPKKPGANGLPLWLNEWQKRVTAATEWTDATQGRAGIAEAYLRWYFRNLCKKNSVIYAEAADEFFAELFKSTANGHGDDFVKGVSWEPQDPPKQPPGPGKPKPPAPHDLPARFDHTHALPLKKAPPPKKK